MAKSAKRKTDNAVTTAADRAPKSPRPAIVTNDDIARRAYDLYFARRRERGHNVDDWLCAECELKEAASSPVVGRC